MRWCVVVRKSNDGGLAVVRLSAVVGLRLTPKHQWEQCCHAAAKGLLVKLQGNRTRCLRVMFCAGIKKKKKRRQRMMLVGFWVCCG